MSFISYLTLIIGLIIGFAVGIRETNFLNSLIYKYHTTPKYALGDCVSNGLFLEEIIEIRSRQAFIGTTLYITVAVWPDGRRGIPDSTDSWIIDDKYTKVNNLNCKR